MQYTDKEIREILDNHGKWLRGDDKGKRANLRGANLRGANLTGANLTRADLTGANLRGANLTGANLTRANLTGADLTGADLTGADLTRADLTSANLRGANLRGANLTGAYLTGANLRGANLTGAYLTGAYLTGTILDGINWLAYLGVVPDNRGMARAYKVVNTEGEGVYQGGVNYLEHKEYSADLNKDVNQQCASGINLATFAWCLNEKQDDRRLFIMKFKVTPENVCAPIGSNGKFRVGKCYKVGECDWQGNLLKEGL